MFLVTVAPPPSSSLMFTHLSLPPLSPVPLSSLSLSLLIPVFPTTSSPPIPHPHPSPSASLTPHVDLFHVHPIPPNLSFFTHSRLPSSHRSPSLFPPYPPLSWFTSYHRFDPHFSSHQLSTPLPLPLSFLTPIWSSVFGFILLSALLYLTDPYPLGSTSTLPLFSLLSVLFTLPSRYFHSLTLSTRIASHIRPPFT